MSSQLLLASVLGMLVSIGKGASIMNINQTGGQYIQDVNYSSYHFDPNKSIRNGNAAPENHTDSTLTEVNYEAYVSSPRKTTLRTHETTKSVTERSAIEVTSNYNLFSDQTTARGYDTTKISTSDSNNYTGNNPTEVKYDRYKVYSLLPENQTQIDALVALEESSYEHLNFWTLVKVLGYPVEIMVADEYYYELEVFIKKYELKNKILYQNVQQLIDAERPPNKSESFSWNYFYDLDKIYEWLDSVEANHSDVLTPIISGYSFEGRPIRGAKVSYKSGNPGIFIESGTHAREWVAITTAAWILKELLTSQDPKIREVAENFDWYIFLCVNPDGYQYSYKTDRFWRKSRSTGRGECVGVDTNRNWDFKWSGGSDPCSIIYPGPEPFSEIETRSLSEYVKNISNKLQVYLDFHSYGQILMFPYSYTKMHAPNYASMMRIGNKSALAMENRFGTHYTVGDIANTVYVANGSSLDWMYGVVNISLCYAYELRDTGQTGLLLPPEEIIPTGLETMDSIVTILQEGKRLIMNDYAVKNNKVP